MNDLFEKNLEKDAPLADRMRPNDLNHFYGQNDLVGESKPLRKAIESDNLSSLIFWGPPGSGKTTLAKIIANKTNAHFVKFSAVISGINDVRKAIKEAKERKKFYDKKTIIFIDEIHRFNKSQQDAFLPYVEDGTIILIGATTENPSFEIISPLLSRSAVFVLKPLSKEAIKKIIISALSDKEKGLGKEGIKISDEGIEKIIDFADGDARVALNSLEFIASFFTGEKKKIDKEEVTEILRKSTLRYDKGGEEHYNLISAFIKSMRDSDPNGALYWLTRMIESGEDPKFIARRMVIFASEDIGNADPQALVLAVSVFRAVEFVGLPEAEINLAQGVIYLSLAPKDNSSYLALSKAKEDARKGSFPVPLHLRNAVTSLMKKLDYGEGYKYAHNYGKGKVNQTHFPKELGEKKYYQPKNGKKRI